MPTSRDEIFQDIISFLNDQDLPQIEFWRKKLWKTESGHVLIWWNGQIWNGEWYEEREWPVKA